MANVFTKSNEATRKPNRNTFPLSFTNNLTLKLGTLTPFCAIETLPGDSFNINPSIGFDMQPMVHPVQTNLRADVHFFYVPNRALWDGWKNFIGNIDSPDETAKMKIPPYINWQNQSQFGSTSLKHGGIADYLGVPTEIIAQDNTYPISYSIGPVYEILEDNKIISVIPSAETFLNNFWEGLKNTTPNITWTTNRTFGTTFKYNSFTEYESVLKSSSPLVDGKVSIALVRQLPLNTSRVTYNSRVWSLTTPWNWISITDSLTDDDVDSQHVLLCLVDKETGEIPSYVFYRPNGNSFEIVSSEGMSRVTVNNNSLAALNVPTSKPSDNYVFVAFNFGLYSYRNTQPSFSNEQDGFFNYVVDARFGVDVASLPLSSIPYRNVENPDGIPISALPYRAYEAIYNSFYRDDRNNPRKVNGRPVFNTFLPTKDGGADTTYYKLYQRNWEQDFLTTSVQSPQQGVAPLVGVTGSGLMTFQDENGVSYTMQATVADDGETITGISSYSSDMPSGTLRAMVDTISTGISINDFRNVNAFQRWLETNMRKGLRYKDQIEAHFGVSPTYSELDLPIFIGGFSRDVDTTAVSQTSQDTSTSALGTKAGQAHVVGSSKAPIKHYCEEHGWIIGIISITPKPVYSQLLNKSLFKSNLLDYFSPEFGHMPYQPILNQEVAPLLCTDEEGKRLTDVFGYQRAWYEYLERQDEAHGDYRSTMRRYLINRLFTGLPQLGNEFLTISQDEANDVFAVTDPNLSKIFGQIHLDIMAKRPIPMLGIPKLEVE